MKIHGKKRLNYHKQDINMKTSRIVMYEWVVIK